EARVHLDRVRHTAACDEVDPVHAEQPERPGDEAREQRSPLEQTIVGGELRVAGWCEDVAAVPETVGAEMLLPGENAGQAEGHRVMAVGGEHDRSGHAGDALLEVAAACHRRATAPDGDAVAAS